MRAKLTLERFDKSRKLLERREQLSRSFTLEFLRLLYVQHAQTTYSGISANAQNCRVASPPGYALFLSENMMGFHYGIVVGSGSGTPAPGDTKLFTPLCHGRNYVSGATPQFTNPSFETGDFTGWTLTNAPTIGSSDWSLKAGSYYCYFGGGAIRAIQQNIDLTNVTMIGFVASVENLWGSIFVYVDSTQLIAVSPPKPGKFVTLYVSGYSGIHTVKFEKQSANSDNVILLDNIQTYGSQLEFGGTELIGLAFGSLSGHNGEFTIRRYFTNHSGHTISITEAGMVAYPGLLIAHDVFSAIDLADGQILRINYVPQITV